MTLTNNRHNYQQLSYCWLRLSRSSVHANLISVIPCSTCPHFDLYLGAMLEFCRICTRLKIRVEQKTGFKTLNKGRQWKHFNLRVRGLPLVSDGA